MFGAFIRIRIPRSAAFLLLAAAITLPACQANPDRLSAEKAFAMSASALSGSDHYGFDGEVSIYDPSGVLAETSRFQGEVTGHGNLNLKWSGGNEIRTRAAGSPGSYHPLQLLEAIGNHKAKVTYDRPPDADGTVRLRVTLDDAAARSRMAASLRAQLGQLKQNLQSRNLAPEERLQAKEILSRADRQMETALSTLRVRTVCLWETDNRTWFPRQMKEQSELTYTWLGKPGKEKRVSVTNFLPAGRNGTMEKNFSTNP
jgi:hypothetical protein